MAAAFLSMIRLSIPIPPAIKKTQSNSECCQIPTYIYIYLYLYRNTKLLQHNTIINRKTPSITGCEDQVNWWKIQVFNRSSLVLSNSWNTITAIFWLFNEPQMSSQLTLFTTELILVLSNKGLHSSRCCCDSFSGHTREYLSANP